MKGMFQRWLFGVIVVLSPMAFGASGPANDDDLTITVVDEGATPDDVVKVIELPGQASSNAASKSAQGIDTANSAANRSESGRDFGQQVSEDARANANDQVRSDAAQQARNDARSDNAGATNRHAPH